MTHVEVRRSFLTALPVMIGYLALGIPCGILCQAAGMTVLQIFLLSVFFYSGAGQFMLPNMIMSGIAWPSALASIALVSSRQMLYSSALSKYFKGESQTQRFFSAVGVTDESFGVCVGKYQTGPWSARQTMFVNWFCHLSWVIATIAGALLASAFTIPTAIAGFAMTSIFACLLAVQQKTVQNYIVAASAALGVIVCKLVNLSEPAILIGALIGLGAGLVADRILGSAESAEGEKHHGVE